MASCFRKYNTKCISFDGFKNEIKNHIVSSVFDCPITTPTEIIQTNDELSEQLKSLSDILQDISIGDHQMTAIDFLHMDNDTPAFYEWFDTSENIVTFDAHEEDDDDEDVNYRSANASTKLTEALEMVQKT